MVKCSVAGSPRPPPVPRVTAKPWLRPGEAVPGRRGGPGDAGAGHLSEEVALHVEHGALGGGGVPDGGHASAQPIVSSARSAFAGRNTGGSPGR